MVRAQFLAIHLLEALAIIAALNSGRMQDPLLGSCLRETWFLAATHKFELRPCQLISSNNRGADLLGRWHLLHTFRDEFLSSFGALGLQQVSVPEDFFQLSDTF